MKIYTLLLSVLLLIGCGSKPAPQAAQPAVMPATQPAEALPRVVAQQPYPAAPEGSPTGAEPSPVQPAPPAQSARPAQAVPQQTEVSIPSGTEVHVRLNQTLDTRRNRSGDRFTASLAEPIQEGGRVIVPKGTIFTGHVTTSSPSGRMQGRAVIGLTLDSFTINGAQHRVVTTRASRVSARHKKRNLMLIGGGSGLGALIGGLAGGGKGALIGAGAGAAVGTAGAAATGKREVSLPAETLLTFLLEESDGFNRRF
jgi:hypothetical protein